MPAPPPWPSGAVRPAPPPRRRRSPARRAARTGSGPAPPPPRRGRKAGGAPPPPPPPAGPPPPLHRGFGERLAQPGPQQRQERRGDDGVERGLGGAAEGRGPERAAQRRHVPEQEDRAAADE